MAQFDHILPTDSRKTTFFGDWGFLPGSKKSRVWLYLKIAQSYGLLPLAMHVVGG